MAETTRRAVVLGAGGAGLAAVLTACASYGQPAGNDAAAPSSEAQPSYSGSEPKASKKADSGGKALAATGDIPEGGGKVFEGKKIVVTQPKAGEFKAFSATCTHQGCTVAEVADGTINCPCHGSKFSIDDGSRVAGPAQKPLPEKQITVDGDEIKLA
ncbi:Rieske (2Fe-2S) protein [Nonomuraea typhae]|uniref:Cytochrome bc1 complex Rieske iron-sulfur subunit n=1 Tax=Nonomuraea typhae TaxID=2603600 RepID=A0ABW7Z5N5_9ACTN